MVAEIATHRVRRRYLDAADHPRRILDPASDDRISRVTPSRSLGLQSWSLDLKLNPCSAPLSLYTRRARPLPSSVAKAQTWSRRRGLSFPTNTPALTSIIHLVKWPRSPAGQAVRIKTTTWCTCFRSLLRPQPRREDPQQVLAVAVDWRPRRSCSHASRRVSLTQQTCHIRNHSFWKLEVHETVPHFPSDQPTKVSLHLCISLGVAGQGFQMLRCRLECHRDRCFRLVQVSDVVDEASVMSCVNDAKASGAANGNYNCLHQAVETCVSG